MEPLGVILTQLSAGGGAKKVSCAAEGVLVCVDSNSPDRPCWVVTIVWACLRLAHSALSSCYRAPPLPAPPLIRPLPTCHPQVNIALVLEEIEKLTTVYEFRIPPYFALILRTFSVIEVRGWARGGQAVASLSCRQWP